MANSTSAAGNNGVAGSYDATVARTVSGTYAGSNLSVSGTHAVRRSVVQTINKKHTSTILLMELIMINN